jgi:hypothetical protein
MKMLGRQMQLDYRLSQQPTHGRDAQQPARRPTAGLHARMVAPAGGRAPAAQRPPQAAADNATAGLAHS